MCDDVGSKFGTNTSDMREQGRAGCVDIHTDAVDHAFDHAVKGMRERGLIDIMLIHAHANGLGIDLDQLSERILRAAGNGYRAADGDIEIGEFGARERLCGIYRSARFVDDKIFCSRCILREFSGELFSFARSSAVADSDERDVMAVDHILQGVDRTLPIVLRFMRIDCARVEEFASGVYHSDFAAGAEARINAEYNMIGKRRLA